MLKKLAASVLLAISFLGFSSIASADDSLYNRLGGTYNIASTVDYFVDMIYINKGLNENPSIKAVHDNTASKAGFKAMLTNWVVQETGGPKIYQPDEFGRGKSMKDNHPHLNISNREFDIIKTLCLATFYQYDIGNHEIDKFMDIYELCGGIAQMDFTLSLLMGPK